MIKYLAWTIDQRIRSLTEKRNTGRGENLPGEGKY